MIAFRMFVLLLALTDPLPLAIDAFRGVTEDATNESVRDAFLDAEENEESQAVDKCVRMEVSNDATRAVVWKRRRSAKKFAEESEEDVSESVPQLLLPPREVAITIVTD